MNTVLICIIVVAAFATVALLARPKRRKELVHGLPRDTYWPTPPNAHRYIVPTIPRAPDPRPALALEPMVAPRRLNPYLRPVETNDDGFATSLLMAAATDNAGIGYMAGGNLAGALIGDALRGDPPAEACAPAQVECARYSEPAPCDTYSSPSYSESSSSYDSGSSYSSCDSSSSSSSWSE